MGVRINASGQLQGIELADQSNLVLPSSYKPASAQFTFNVSAAQGSAAVSDMNPVREGKQVQVVIVFPKGVQANSFMLYDPASRTWYDYTDANAANGAVDGAALVDVSNDGLTDAVVITLTDAGLGDNDATPNGVLAHMGMLATRSAPQTLVSQSFSLDSAASSAFEGVITIVGVTPDGAGY